jgi:hypothetical protein
MKPRISILDRAFAYKPSYETTIADTWRRFGWRPTKRFAQEPQSPPRTSVPRARIWHSERTTNLRGST